MAENDPELCDYIPTPADRGLTQCGLPLGEWNQDCDCDDCDQIRQDGKGEKVTSCAYYKGVGVCSFGCWEEPRCMTNEPLDGWLGDGGTGVFSVGREGDR